MGEMTPQERGQVKGIAVAAACVLAIGLVLAAGYLVAAGIGGVAVSRITARMYRGAAGRRLPVPPSPELAHEQAVNLGLEPIARQEAPTSVTHEEVATSRLDYAALVSTLDATDDPLATLKLAVGDIRTREAARDDLPAGTLPPSGLERFLARSLEEAGLFSNDIDMPAVRMVRPHRSGLFFLRCEDDTLSYGARLRILSLEAAMNSVHFAHAVLPEPDSQTLEQCYLINQQLMSSICSQLPALDEPGSSRDGSEGDGEWAVRQAIAVGLETFQVPFRLETSFRTNVAGGAAAVEVAVTPSEVFPRSYWSAELGRMLPTTGLMRRQQASAYALRLGILVASHVLRCSERISHVLVAGVLDTSTSHTCHYSVDFDRERLLALDLTAVSDPVATYESFAATLSLEDGVLQPVVQTFSLEEERFCPARRYESVDLSDRRLDGDIARRLGTDTVAGLGIHEEARREHVATDIARELGSSTEKNVSLILGMSRDDPDPTVRSSADRTVSKLIDGTLSEENFLDVEDEFVSGDELTQAVRRSADLLEAKDPAKAVRILTAALRPIDAAGTYEDTGLVTWHAFQSYVERALFNRLHPTEGREVRLVPDSYYDAQLVLSSALLLTDDATSALAHARRCVELDPLGSQGYLRETRCHETLGDYSSAIDSLLRLLEVAHDPDTLGIAYYRLAFMEWKGANLLAARACYRKSLTFQSSCSTLAVMELHTLELTNADGPDELADGAAVDAALVAHGIPIAPTEQISDGLMECAEASLDAEVFPVARNFATLLCSLTGDDVMVDIVRSIEAEPDR
jgi:tetratricopeptide (TPR) repeat protein